jgi:hypothetical protein
MTGLRFLYEPGDISHLLSVLTCSEAHTVPDAWVLSTGMKRPKRQVGHSTSFTAEIKNRGGIPQLLHPSLKLST